MNMFRSFYLLLFIFFIFLGGCSDGKNAAKEKIVNKMSILKSRIGLLEPLTTEELKTSNPDWATHKDELKKCRFQLDSLEMELKKY